MKIKKVLLSFLFLSIIFFMFSENKNIDFTDLEKKFIKNNPVIILAIDDNNPPMNYRNTAGEMEGISIDYLNLIAEKIGIKIDYYGSNWNDALGKAMDHKADGIVNAAIKEDRKAFLNFTEPYFITPLALVTEIEGEEIDHLSQLDNMKVAAVKGSVRIDLLKEYSPGADIVEINDLEDGFKLIVEKKIDAVFDDLVVIQHLIDKYHFSQLKISLLYYAKGEGDSRLGLRNNSPELLSIFNKAILNLTTDERRDIKNKWLSSSVKAATQHEIELTEEEKQWLDKHKIIRTASDPFWAPIEYKDNSGEFKGISIEYLKYIEKNLGVKFELQKDLSWVQMINLAKKKEIDIFTAISKTEERLEYLDFTEPYLKTPIVIFTQQNISYISNLKELKGKKVSVVESYAVHEWIKNDYPDINIIPVNNIKEGLEMLNKGRIDAFIGNLVTVSHYLNKLHFINIKVSGETPYSQDLSIGIRKDWPVFKGILEKTFQQITQEERDEFINKWLTVKYEHGFDYKLFVRILIIIIIIIAVILFCVFWLLREIRKRKMEKELIQHKERLERLVAERTREIENTIHRLKNTQKQLIHSEKMASLGLLISGIAHEINNPLNFISSGVEGLNENLMSFIKYYNNIKKNMNIQDEEAELIINDIKILIENIQIGVDRSAEIIKNLKDFARQDKDVKAHTNIHDSINLALSMLHNRYKDEIEIIKNYGDIPELFVNKGQMDQVFLNILNNSVDAVKSKNKLENEKIVIETKRVKYNSKNHILISIKDTGTGVEKKNINKIFDPFFTTKEVGKGTGLGLSISHNIIEKHGGDIIVESSNKGACFNIYLPYSNKK